MSLTKYHPQALVPLQEVVDRWFDNMVGSRLWRNDGDESWRPAIDIYEDDKSVILKLDVPEMDTKDFDIEISEDVLTVSGERKPATELKEEGFARRERPFGPLRCSITLPKSAQSEKVAAKYDQGVLTVTVPKRAGAKTAAKRIPVS